MPAPPDAFLLGGLSAEERQAVLAQAVPRRFARGATILRRGDPGQSAVVVTSGRVRVSVTSDEGREITLGILGPGDVLGELALLDGEARSADAVALEACAVLMLDRARFLRVLRDTPDLGLRLLAVLAARLRRANQALEDIALLPLETRLANLLVRLARDYGKPARPGTRIELRLSQKDLSTLVGCSREKVNRQLRAWEDDGTVGKDQGYLVIRHPQRLESGPG